MKSSITAAAAMMLAAFTGCNRGEPGGPGATDPKKEHTFNLGSADNSFTLSVPSSVYLLSTSLKQGGTTPVKISINRGKNFAQDVSLKFEGLPPGVTYDQANAEIKNGQSEANLTFTAKDGTALGNFEIKVVGHPASGGDATNNFKLTMDKEATFTVSTSSTSIKQGETKAVTITIKREKTFDQDVAFKFSDLPKGTTLDPASPVIKHGDTEAQIMLKSDNDASVGDFAIKVTGHPAKGPDASHDFNITVAKK